MSNSEQEYKLAQDHEEMGKHSDELQTDEFLAKEAKYAINKSRHQPMPN